MNRTLGPSNQTLPQKCAHTISTLAVTTINAWATPTWEIHSSLPTTVIQRENTNSGYMNNKRNWSTLLGISDIISALTPPTTEKSHKEFMSSNAMDISTLRSILRDLKNSMDSPSIE